jgi:hypothetical protein
MGPDVIDNALAPAMNSRTAWHTRLSRSMVAEMACASIILVYAVALHDFGGIVDTLAVDADASSVTIRAGEASRHANAQCEGWRYRDRNACRREARARFSGAIAEAGPGQAIAERCAFAPAGFVGP